MTTNTQQLDAMIERVRAAQAVFARYDQGQVDAIFPVSYTHLTLPTICSV